MLDTIDDDAAKVLLEALRWGDNGPTCPSCSRPEPGWLAARRIYRCKACRKQFSVTSGTIFDKHKLSLGALATAMLWYEKTSGKGPTADLARLIDVTWKTAYVLKMRMWEGYVTGSPLRAAPLFARGYWQGYNRWSVSPSGALQRSNKHGTMKTVT